MAYVHPPCRLNIHRSGSWCRHVSPLPCVVTCGGSTHGGSGGEEEGSS